MEYSIIKLDEYDKALKINNRRLLCYSPKEFKKLQDDAPAEKEPKVVGEVNKYTDRTDDYEAHLQDPEKYPEPENVLTFGKERYAVLEPGDTSGIRYACRGYVMVGEDEYIALYRSRIPFLLILLGLLAAGILGFVLVASLTPEPTEPVLNPLPPIDSNVEVEEPSEPAESAEGGGMVNMTYQPSATLSLGAGTIDMYFLNPGKSNHDVVVELYVVSDAEGTEGEYKIAESGRIPAGSKLTSLTLEADPALFQGEGTYDAKYTVQYYDPATGEKALVDTVLDEIVLTVKN